MPDNLTHLSKEEQERARSQPCGADRQADHAAGLGAAGEISALFASREAGSEPSGACRRCVECEGEEHHWMYVGDEDASGEPVMSCKHCHATRPVEDDDE